MHNIRSGTPSARNRHRAEGSGDRHGNAKPTSGLGISQQPIHRGSKPAIEELPGSSTVLRACDWVNETRPMPTGSPTNPSRIRQPPPNHTASSVVRPNHPEKLPNSGGYCPVGRDNHRGFRDSDGDRSSDSGDDDVGNGHLDRRRHPRVGKPPDTHANGTAPHLPGHGIFPNSLPKLDFPKFEDEHDTKQHITFRSL